MTSFPGKQCSRLCVWNEHLYGVGGRSAYKYDDGKDVWQKLPPMNEHRPSPNVFVYDFGANIDTL